MRRFFAVLFLFITVGLIYVLDNAIGKLPALGRLVDPVNGLWANAEPVSKDFSCDSKLSALKGNAQIWLDDRLVPHIRAANTHDLYYLQGFVHATFRLWQMEMQTRAAGGRISEVVGRGALNFDREKRRLGMVYAAENSLKMMEADPETKVLLDAYTAGVNAFIGGLKYRDYPIEYKLMNFAPENWTNLKTALLMKYMADDLTGYTEDIQLTLLRDKLGAATLDLLFPEKIVGSTPVIPAGTQFGEASLQPVTKPDNAVFPRFADAEKFAARGSKNEESDFNDIIPKRKHYNDGIGSNNWAVGKTRTADSSAILCNDPHLGVNLPSIWYEVQLEMPGMNVYGVSLPGAPGVIIGFNDSLAWGFTNNYRDVKDYYTITYTDGAHTKYLIGGSERPVEKRLETIAIKGGTAFTDTVNYTVHGPVLYDDRFPEPTGFKKPLAVCWMAHRPSNEIKAVYSLNKATSYEGFVDAITQFTCPAQNMLYADRHGNIALWGQGQFVNKWRDQGKYIMNGADTGTLWKELIPMKENPNAYNPEQGFLSSANQNVTDTTYPYWYNGHFKELRAWRINQVLRSLTGATVKDMFALQQDNFSLLAANTLPLMVMNLSHRLDSTELRYLHRLKGWNYSLDAESEAATIYQIWWHYLYNDIWSSYPEMKTADFLPNEEVTAQLLKGGRLIFNDKGWGLNENYDKKYYEKCGRIVFDTTEKLDAATVEHPIVVNNKVNPFVQSFKLATDSLKKLERTTGLQWYKVKNTAVKHLAKISPFGWERVKIGGWGNTVNAAKTDHAPSWRMVVKMGKEIEAYGTYPGGQSGNPGCRAYDDFITDWAAGKYYKILFVHDSDKMITNNSKNIMIYHP
jgi:penicillin G amidase